MKESLHEYCLRNRHPGFPVPAESSHPGPLPEESPLIPNPFDSSFSTFINKANSLQVRGKSYNSSREDVPFGSSYTHHGPTRSLGITADADRRRLPPDLSQYCAIFRNPGAPECGNGRRHLIDPDIECSDAFPPLFDPAFDALLTAARFYRLPRDYQSRKSHDAKYARLRTRAYGGTDEHSIGRPNRSRLDKPNRRLPGSLTSRPISVPVVAGGDIEILSPFDINFPFKTFAGSETIKRGESRNAMNSLKNPSSVSKMKGRLPPCSIAKPT